MSGETSRSCGPWENAGATKRSNTALRDQGHEVRVIPTQFVKPFVKSNKNDFIDAEAIAEAVTRQNMRFVPIKTVDQLDLQALHRIRERLVQRRTALINQIRGFLLERGISFAKGPSHLRKNMADIVEDADVNLTRRMRIMLDRRWVEWRQLDYDIEMASEDIERIAGEDEACQRLRQIPGVGPLVSTATVAAIGNGAAFRKGANSQPGSGLCRDNTPLVARRSSSASASAATAICGACSFTVPGPCFSG